MVSTGDVADAASSETREDETMYSFNFVVLSNDRLDAIRGACSPTFAAGTFAVTFSSFLTGSPLDVRKRLLGDGSLLAAFTRHGAIASSHRARNPRYVTWFIAL